MLLMSNVSKVPKGDTVLCRGAMVFYNGDLHVCCCYSTSLCVFYVCASVYLSLFVQVHKPSFVDWWIYYCVHPFGNA